MFGAASRRRLGEQDGAAIVEFAAVTLLLLALVYGIITYGVVFSVEQSVTHAAADAARAAVGVPTSEAADRSRASAISSLSWLGDKIRPEDITTSVANCDFDPTLPCVFVSIHYPYGDRPVIPRVPLLDIALPDLITTQAALSLER